MQFLYNLFNIQLQFWIILNLFTFIVGKINFIHFVYFYHTKNWDLHPKIGKRLFVTLGEMKLLVEGVSIWGILIEYDTFYLNFRT
jgi:hypothetical protein